MGVPWTISAVLVLSLTLQADSWKKKGQASTILQQGAPQTGSSSVYSWSQGNTLLDLSGGTSAEVKVQEQESPLIGSEADHSWSIASSGRGDKILDLSGDASVSKDVTIQIHEVEPPVIGSSPVLTWSLEDVGRGNAFVGLTGEASVKQEAALFQGLPALTGDSSASWSLGNSGQEDLFLDLSGESSIVGGFSEVKETQPSMGQSIESESIDNSKFDNLQWQEWTGADQGVLLSDADILELGPSIDQSIQAENSNKLKWPGWSGSDQDFNFLSGLDQSIQVDQIENSNKLKWPGWSGLQQDINFLSELDQSIQGSSIGDSKFNKLQWPEWSEFDQGFDLSSDAEISELGQFGLPKFELPKIKKVIVTEEASDEDLFKLPKLEIPEIEKGPVKEVPVHVYRLPPWPKLPKIESPKIEPVKELPLVVYEMPPLPEIKPLPLQEMKFPELRIEKYILPPLPKLEIPEMPKIKPLKDIPLVMYEFPMPDIKPLELPKIKPIKEIPIVMFDLPPIPKMKQIVLPKIKMPEVKIIKKKLPPLPKMKPIEMPKLDWKLPEIKVVKYQMPEKKPFEWPKMPEIKYVKYEMPPVEKQKLPEIKPLPEFKLPEMKPLPEFKLPEFKLPEIKPLELPKLPELKVPEMYPMYLPPVQYMYAPVMPQLAPFPYQLVSMGQPVKGIKHFGGLKSKFVGSGIEAPQPVILNANAYGEMNVQGQSISDQINSQYLVNQILTNTGGPGAAGGFYGSHPHGYNHHHPWGSQVLVIAGNDAVLQGSGGYSKVLSARDNTGLKFDTVAPWTQHYSPFINAQYDNIGNLYAVLEKNLANGELNRDHVKDVSLGATADVVVGGLDKEISADIHLTKDTSVEKILSTEIIQDQVTSIEGAKDLLAVGITGVSSAVEETKDLLATAEEEVVSSVEEIKDNLADELQKGVAVAEEVKDLLVAAETQMVSQGIQELNLGAEAVKEIKVSGANVDLSVGAESKVGVAQGIPDTTFEADVVKDDTVRKDVEEKIAFESDKDVGVDEILSS